MKVCPHCRTEYGPDQAICPNDGTRLDALEPLPDPLIGKVLADRYRIIRTLGEGGMGRVYLAEHVRMGRLSAVKVMSPALAPTADAIGRFNREAANASRINHPNVAAIYDFGETADGVLYLAMEFVDGETLGAWLKRAGSLSLVEAGELTRQIAEALNAAHQLGIVHRDLKPDNVLVMRDADGHQRVKVVDFGIAKATQGAGQTLTTAGMSIGTPEFMSPEQLAGESLDARTDIYSLGLVTFTMLTGETPFPDLSSKQSLVQRLTTRPRGLAEVVPSTTWPARLQAALDRALSPEPEDRYRKASEFALDVVAATSTMADQGLGRTHAMTPLATTLVAPATDITAPASAKRRSPVAIGAAILVFVAAGFLAWRSTHESSPTTSNGVTARGRADTSVAGVPTSAVPAAKPIEVPASASGAVSASARATGAKPTAPRRNDSAATRISGASNLAATRRADSQRVIASAAESRDSLATKARVLAPPSPVPSASVVDSSATRFPAGALLRPQRAGRHAWLGANGDSSSANPSDSGLANEAREVMGHINRTRKFFQMGQPGRALPELRTASEEYSVFAAEHPGTRQTAMLRQQLVSVTEPALADCRTSTDSTPPRMRMCDGLAKAAKRFEGSAPASANPFFRARRQPGRGIPPG